MCRIDTSAFLFFPCFFNFLVSFYPKLFFLFTCKNGKAQDTDYSITTKEKIINYCYIIIIILNINLLSWKPLFTLYLSFGRGYMERILW